MANVTRHPCDEGVIRSKDPRSPCAPKAGTWVLAATIPGSSMAFIDETGVTVALPAVQRSLNATAVGAQWMVKAYTLLLASLVLVGGSLGDRLGRRRVFSAGVALFALASAWSGLAASPEQLIAARALQGIGGALLVPNSLAIIGASFEEERRGGGDRYLGGLHRPDDGAGAGPRGLFGREPVLAVGVLYQRRAAGSGQEQTIVEEGGTA